MEIKVNVSIDFSENAAALITRIFGALSTVSTPGEAITGAAEQTAEAPKKTRKSKTEAAAAPAEYAAEAPKADKKTMSLEDVQKVCMKLIDSDEDNREKISEIRASFGAPSLSKMDPADYAAFVEKVKALDI